MMFKKITIIGVGLIGGSIGLAAKKKKLSGQITGVCRHQNSLHKAKLKGAIDQKTLNYKAAVSDADLVILALPVNQIIKIGKKISPFLKPGCIVTDVGSTKEKVVHSLDRVLPAGVPFVGTHPLAGSEKRGVTFARADLFKEAICIITAGKKATPTSLKKIVKFWNKLGARTIMLKPKKHDQIVALISHLPHLAAVQLVKTAKKALPFASSGFYDTTRIASSDAEIWTDIFLSNKKFIQQAIDKYISYLKLVKGLIRKGDRKRLSTEFRKTKRLRDSLKSSP